jgi:FixJ family two-component response regulator
MSEQTVFIIDDDPSVRKGLTRLLHAAGIHAESFESASNFLAEGNCERPGCILLDVHMPDMTGPELQEKLIKAGCCLPIIFLTAHGDVPTAALAMKKGAVDFLEKPVNSDDLLEIINISLAQDKENRAKKAESSDISERIRMLTPREHEVMTYVITGMLNKQIAAEMQISEETVKIHRGRVMQKLGIVSVAELVQLCNKAGISPNQLRSQQA